VSTRWWDEGHQAFEELASLHQDVGGSVTPAGLEAQGERSTRAGLEPLAGEWRSGDIAAEPLEAATISGRDGHFSVQAHAPVLRNTPGCLRVRIGDLGLRGLDTISEPTPTLPLMRSRGAAALQGGRGEQREQGLVASERVFVILDPGFDHALDTPCSSGEHARHLVCVGWRERQEAKAPPLSPHVDAVQRERVKVEVQVQCRTETLDEDDGSALVWPHLPVVTCPSTQLCEQRAEERAEHSTRESCVVGTSVAERVGQGEYPLPDRDLGEHPIDEVRGGLRHSTPATRGTEAAALARERDQAIVTTLVAVQAEEAMRQDAATQEGAKLLLDEARDRLIPVGRAREKALELSADDLVEEGLLRVTALVLAHEIPFRDQRG
jgi:hypothetical protein